MFKSEVQSRPGELTAELVLAQREMPALRAKNVAYAIPEAERNPLDADALKTFLKIDVLTAEDTIDSRPLTVKEFLTAVSQLSAKQPSGFTLVQLETALERNPTAASFRNMQNALEHLVGIGVVNIDLSNYPHGAALYSLAEDPKIPLIMNASQQALPAAALEYAESLMNVAVSNKTDEQEPPFVANMKVSDYLNLRAAGATITTLLNDGTPIDPQKTYYGSPVLLLERIEESAEAHGLFVRSPQDPRKIILHPAIENNKVA